MNTLLPFKSGLLATLLFLSHSGYATDVLENIPVEGSIIEKAEGSVVKEAEGSVVKEAEGSVFEEIVVTAEFRDVNLLDTGNSISVVDSETIHRRGAQHLEQVLNLVPNVNFSSGASRGRFFQIRGIGERSQFIEPVNPSVGILIDGIDFSGIGGAATTLDVQQIEIFRGPQGTLFGANALAGLIDMKSNDPSESFEGNFETSFAEYETRTVSGVISGPMTDNLGYRLAVQQHKSDGYVENDFLNRDDTNNIDEQTVRGKLHWQVNDELEVKFTGFYLDADNGYDSFSLDNNRHTLSDQPGHDRQESTAFSVESTWKGAEQFDVVSQISYAESNLEYSYDEDWTFTDICSGQPCDGWAYSSFDNYLRDRETKTVDLRLASNDQGLLFNDTTDWVLGVYYRDQEESLLREYTFNPGDFVSDFDTKNYAIYGQLGSQLTDNLRLTSGLRLEYRNADYWDSDGVNNDKGERLWGGRLGLEYHITDNTMVYGLVSRGYKAGGVNSDPALDDDYRTFGTERMWNFETGIKGDWFDGALQTQLALFYQKRTKMQVKQSLVECPPGPGSCTFTDYLDNAEKGANYGAELEFTWLALDIVQVYGSLGLLRATFKDYKTFNHVDVDKTDPEPVPKNLSGHEQAHAPSYQFAIGIEIALTHNLTAGLELEGKESFYLSPRHNAKTNRYELVNARLNYRLAGWEVSLWGRNLADRDVIVRGFGSFGNDPRQCPDPSTPSSCYPVEPFYQYGEPRIVGATAKYRF